MKTKISFLISCYEKDDPLALKEALFSINESDNKYEVEVVIVIDGIVNNKIKEIINEYKDFSNNQIIIEQLIDNSGLGIALSKGSKVCSGEYIFRIDSDDISIPSRVDTCIDFLNKKKHVMALGGFIEEFKDNPKDLMQIRKVPLNMQEITKFSYLRNPMNHVTVCFRKSFFNIVNYMDMPLAEDYYLWMRAIKKNLILHNLPEVMVHVRVKEGIGNRRNGLSYFKKDINFAMTLYKENLFSIINLLKYLLVRMFVRFVPSNVISVFYKVFLRN